MFGKKRRAAIGLGVLLFLLSLVLVGPLISLAALDASAKITPEERIRLAVIVRVVLISYACSSVAAGGLVYSTRKFPHAFLGHALRLAGTCLLSLASSFTAGLLVASVLKWPDWDSIAGRWVR